MNEAKLYEALGRKQAQVEAQDQAYTELIHLLARVVSGEVARARVVVSLADRTWTLAAGADDPTTADPTVPAE
jgi:hypothetical protein